MSKNRIVELASDILLRADEIDKALVSTGHPPLSLELDAAPELPPITSDAQNALLEATDELQALYHASTSIHVILRFGVAHAFPVGSRATFAEISQACNLDVEDVKRILRHAMTHRIFAESCPGYVVHTPASRLLVEDEHLVSWIHVVLDELLPAASRMVDAMQRWPRSQEPSQAGLNIAHNESETMFEVFERHPLRAHRLAQSMKLFTETPVFSLEHTVNNFEWGLVRKVVDIGGSSGHVSIAIAKAYAYIQCVVQDLTSVVDGIEAPPELRDRVVYMAHNFMHEQPIKDADVYFLRWVLHDWSDLYAVKILRALIPALSAGCRVVINDSCLPGMGEVSLYQQRFARATDLTMRQIQNARERDPEDWRMLLELTDTRFRLERIIRPQGAALSIIVVEWAVGD
ncbi:MAG: hypothetical protein Q9160_008896 [Pyrenula sp. 1 TL-2023]